MKYLSKLLLFVLAPLVLPSLAFANPDFEKALIQIEKDADNLAFETRIAHRRLRLNELRKMVVQLKLHLHQTMEEIKNSYPELSAELAHLQPMNVETARILLDRTSTLRDILIRLEFETRNRVFDGREPDNGQLLLLELNKLLCDFDTLLSTQPMHMSEILAQLGAIQRAQNQLIGLLHRRAPSLDLYFTTENLCFLQIECANLLRMANELRHVLVRHRTATLSSYVVLVVSAFQWLTQHEADPVEPRTSTLLLSPFSALLL